MTRGRFITLEGGEGAGKSTQVGTLAAALRARGLDVITTREPGGSAGAEEIRTLLVTGGAGRWSALTEALLHFAARRDHLERVVWPALASGCWVVSDRFVDSTIAYQGYGLGLDRAVIGQLSALALEGFRPDLTLVLDLPPEIGLSRALARGLADRYERMDMTFHQRLRDGFLDIARQAPERYAVVNAEASPVAVAQAVLSAVDQRLSLPVTVSV
jgi:dTMP kinase